MANALSLAGTLVATPEMFREGGIGFAEGQQRVPLGDTQHTDKVLVELYDWSLMDRSTGAIVPMSDHRWSYRDFFVRQAEKGPLAPDAVTATLSGPLPVFPQNAARVEERDNLVLVGEMVRVIPPDPSWRTAEEEGWGKHSWFYGAAWRQGAVDSTAHRPRVVFTGITTAMKDIEWGGRYFEQNEPPIPGAPYRGAWYRSVTQLFVYLEDCVVLLHNPHPAYEAELEDWIDSTCTSLRRIVTDVVPVPYTWNPVQMTDPGDEVGLRGWEEHDPMDYEAAKAMDPQFDAVAVQWARQTMQLLRGELPPLL